MAHEVIRGKLVTEKHGTERIAVTYITAPPGGGTEVLQFINAALMLKRWKGDDGLNHFAGPVFAGWENLLHTQKDLRGFQMIGCICAEPDGSMKGRIDWVRPVDGGKIAEMRKALIDERGEKLPDTLTHQVVKLPFDLKTFAEQLVMDPVLNAEMVELAENNGSTAQMVEAILKAAVRTALGEA